MKDNMRERMFLICHSCTLTQKYEGQSIMRSRPKYLLSVRKRESHIAKVSGMMLYIDVTQ